MKFTKEQAVEEITAKITDKDKDIDLVRTVEECVENALKMVGENEQMELNAFVSFVMPFVSTAAGLAHKHAVTATETLQEKIAKLEKKGNTNDDQKKGQKKDTEQNDAVKVLLDRVEALEKNIAENDKATKIAEKRKQLIAKMSEDIKDNEWIEGYLAEINVTADTDVEAKAKDYVAFYNKTHTKGGKVTPKSTDGGEDSDTKYVKNTVAEAAKIKKSLSATAGGSTVRSTTTNNNN